MKTRDGDNPGRGGFLPSLRRDQCKDGLSHTCSLHTIRRSVPVTSDVCSLASYCPELQIIGDPPSRNTFLPAKFYTNREDHITLVSNCAVATKAISTWRLIGVPFLAFSSVMCNIPTHAAVFTYNL